MARKWRLAMLHELLSMTMEKRMTSLQLDAFHYEYMLPARLLLCLVKNHDSLRASKREMAVATREKKLVAEIKQTAKTGNETATKILTRQLVRLHQQITNLQGSHAQIRGVATHTQALYACTSISTGMKGATKAMVAMNKIVDTTI